MTTIWKFKTAQFTVTVDAIDDPDTDLSWDDDGSVMEGLEDGSLVAFAVRARCRHNASGVEGTDYLGGCIYRSPDEFMDHRGRNAKGHGSYFSDMVRACIAECREACATVPTMRARTA